jgi:threonyl-tRNA synthetase
LKIHKIILPGVLEREVKEGTTYLEALSDVKPLKEAMAIRVNGAPRDLRATVTEDAKIELLTFATPEGREVYRHSSAHLMAQAVKELFPSVKMTIGPAIEEGFYYDFDFERPFTPEDLERIEARMREIAKRNLPIHRMELEKEEAIALFRERGEPYKVELIAEIPEGEKISAYRQGEFIDLCAGPHLPSTGSIKAFKLLSSGGAYWRGSEKNRMLQRIYGASFPRKEELEEHLKKLEEIKKRDHRRLGKDLDLFSVSEEVGPGLILWHPKGAIVRKTIEDFWREEHLKAGYELVFTPHMARLDLWRTSGHTSFYKENMFSPMDVEGTEYQIKPMNCPFHIQIYKTHLRSYRDLPLRWAELGTVYRYERSGVLHGLLRVRGFTQDDAHLFCSPDQIQGEILRVLDFTTFVLKSFGFDEYEVYLSTRPENHVGSTERWEQATAALEGALKAKGLRYAIDPGEGVFYGPKIDMKIKDALGRSWQCTTIQVDFNLPERFGLTYIGEDGKTHQPIMIHRALMGSIERFFGVLLEHYGGAFPLWLAPVQARVLPITERQHPYAGEVGQALRGAGFRAEVDARNEKVGFKIREAQLAKVPYMVIVGDREMERRTLTVRKRTGENIEEIALENLVEALRKEASERRVTP